VTSARKTLPRLDFDYPPGTVERVCAEADKQGRDLAQAATADELRQAWRDEGHDYELPRDEQYLDMVRCWHQGHQANRLPAERTMDDADAPGTDLCRGMPPSCSPTTTARSSACSTPGMRHRMG